MKIGMTVEPCKGVAFNKIILLLKLAGLSHLEINMTTIPKVDRFIKKLGRITTTFHLPIYDRFHFDLGTTNMKFEKKINDLIEFLNKNKQKLNLRYVLTHPPEGPDSTSDKLIERLTKIDVPILIENIAYQTDEQFLTFYRKAKLVLGEKLVGHALDVPHRYITDNKNWLNIPKELEEIIEYVHISDCSKTSDLHLPLGMAELPYKDFFDYLKQINYQGIILQEIIPDVEHIMFVFDSLLYNIKPFSKKRFRRLQILYGIIRPIVQLGLNSTFKHLRKEKHNILLKDIGYELGYQN